MSNISSREYLYGDSQNVLGFSTLEGGYFVKSTDSSGSTSRVFYGFGIEAFHKARIKVVELTGKSFKELRQDRVSGFGLGVSLCM